MTKLRTAVIGDIGDTRTVRIDGIEDLTAVASVAAHVWQALREDRKYALAASVLDAAERTITVELGADAEGWLTAAAVPGEWLIEYEFTFTNGDVNTWPGEPDKITVRAAGDPPA